jgi:hypothetical protein
MFIRTTMDESVPVGAQAFPAGFHQSVPHDFFVIAIGKSMKEVGRKSNWMVLACLLFG